MSIEFPTIILRQSPIVIIPWADATPDEITLMLQAHDRGDINIYDYWSIGDERKVSLSAMAIGSAGSFYQAMDAQTVTMVLMNEGYMGQSGIHYVVGQKESLSKQIKMDPNNSNIGTWSSSPARTDINDVYAAAFPSDELSLYKSFTVKTSADAAGTSMQTTTDKFALFAEAEVFGSSGTYGPANEESELSQIEYYKTAANRKKARTNSATTAYWWLRTPYYSTSRTDRYCSVASNGTSNWYAANSTSPYCAPFGCI